MRTTLALIWLVAFLALPGQAPAQCTFLESFTGGFQQLWSITNPTAARVEADVLRVQFSGSPSDFHGIVADECVYTDLSIRARVRDRAFSRGKAIAFRMSGAFVGYNVNFRSAPFNDVILGKGPFATASVAATAAYPHASEEWLDVVIDVIGNNITVYVDGTQVISYTDSQPFPDGWVFLGINAGGTLFADAEFDDVQIAERQPAIPTAELRWGSLKGRFGIQE